MYMLKQRETLAGKTTISDLQLIKFLTRKWHNILYIVFEFKYIVTSICTMDQCFLKTCFLKRFLFLYVAT